MKSSNNQLKSALCLLLITCAIIGYAQPRATTDDISISKVMSTTSSPIRIDRHPLTNEVYILNDRGDIYHIDLANGLQTKIFSSSDHGLYATFGLEIGATGNFYVAAAENSGGNNIGKVAKGVPNEDGSAYEWTLLAETEPYRESGNRDHKFNAIIESTDGKYVYVNSGSRTDHSEKAQNDGGREMPITSAILKIPVSAENLVLENNAAYLEANDLIYADGTRNTFDLEYAANGDLFGVENSDTRDNEEELNWLEEGKHYGFPWKIGTYDNPQQFPDFNPPGSDNLIVQGINMEGTFYNDPSFPATPEGVTFTEPILNYGPDGDVFRDLSDGEIKDASDLGESIGTFTPHSSPLALTFDTENLFGGIYTGGGFAMSYNASHQRKYEPFLDPGEDLMFLDLTKEDDIYKVNVTRIAQGFSGPIDAVILENKMYVLEYSGSAIWEVTFPSNKEVLSLKKTASSISPLVSVYPNPVAEKISLSSTFETLRINGAALYDLQGNLLKAFQTDGHSHFANSSDLAAGVYFIQVETNLGIALKKVIKQ